MKRRITAILIPASVVWATAAAFAFDGQKAVVPPPNSSPVVQTTDPSQAGDARAVRGRRSSDTPFASAKVGVITLENADAREIAGPLKVLTNEFPADVVLSGFAEGKVLLIAAQDDATLERMKQIAAMIDEASPPASAEGRATISVALQHADAVQVAQMISVLSQNRHCQFVPDPRTNTLWLSGEEPQIVAMQRVAQQLDAASAKPEADKSRTSREMQYYVLMHTPAGELAKTLRQLVSADQQLRDCEIVENAASNTCIVLASPESQKRIAEIVKILDRAVVDRSNATDRTPAGEHPQGDDRAPAGERAPRQR